MVLDILTIFEIIVTCFLPFVSSEELLPEQQVIAHINPPPWKMASPGGPGYRSVAYFPNWGIYAREFRPQHMPAERLTHVLYAFANVRQETGEVILTDTWADLEIHYEGDSWNDTGTNLYGCLKQFQLLKKRNRNLKILLSIGGWTFSKNFRGSGSTTSPQGRANFVKSALQLVKDLGFDGLDIDWEYPQDANDAASYVALLHDCRRALDEYGATLNPPYHFELTVACPAGAQNYEKLDLPGMDRYLDFWNLMAYDYAGSWDRTAGHQANLYPHPTHPALTPFSTTAALQYYMSHGVAPHKMVLGMPLYGRGFAQTDGLGHPFQGGGQGTWEAGVYDFKKLPLPGAQEVFDPVVGTSYCYDPRERMLVTYDTRDAALAKAAFIRDRGLGGAMWWEASADKQGADSLVKTVVDALGGSQALQQRPNCLTFPATKYDNLRNGFPNDH